jgi:hypothetical protein
MATVSDSIDINAPAQVVFDLISRLERMGEISPEATGGTWLKSATGPAVGAKFKGSNTHGKMTWNTTSTVVVCDAPRSFAFEVTFGPAKVARWQYDIASTDTGCRVTETWIDRRSSLSKRFAKTPAGDRDEYTPKSIRETLENLKRRVEG